jgi:hypothetical protein
VSSERWQEQVQREIAGKVAIQTTQDAHWRSPPTRLTARAPERIRHGGAQTHECSTQQVNSFAGSRTVTARIAAPSVRASAAYP